MTPELHAGLLACLRNVWFYSSVGLNIGLGLVFWAIKHFGLVCS